MHAESFKKLVQAIGATTAVESIIFKCLTDSYSEHHRFYHTYDHIKAGLCEMTRDIDADDILLLQFAYLYHDVVYLPCYDGNEEASAARMWIDGQHLGISTKVLYKIKELIMATTHACDVSSRDHKLIIDIDLAIFGQSYNTVLEYDENIRKEYFWLGDMTYLPERVKILGQFRKKEHIYHTKWFQDKYEETARENLDRLIASLQSDLLSVPRC